MRVNCKKCQSANDSKNLKCWNCGADINGIHKSEKYAGINPTGGRIHPFVSNHPASCAYRITLSPHEWTWTQEEVEAMARYLVEIDGFTEGEPTRYDEPTNDKTMIMECKGYEQTWPLRKVKMTRSDGRVIYDSTSNA